MGVGVFLFYSQKWSSSKEQSFICQSNCSHLRSLCTLHPTPSLIIERNCEQSHCAQSVRPAFLEETKAPSVAERATVLCHHSAELQTEWLPTHSCSTHTAVVADNTGKTGPCQRIQRVLKEELENLNGVGERTAGTGPPRSRLFVQNCVSHLRLEEHMCVCVCPGLQNSYRAFMQTRLVIYTLMCFGNLSILFSCCRNCWIRFFKGATTEWLATDEDDNMTKPTALNNRLQKWTLPFDCAEHESKYQCRSWYNSSLTSAFALVRFSRVSPLHSCYRVQHLFFFWKISAWQSFKNIEGHLTSLTAVLKDFSQSPKTPLSKICFVRCAMKKPFPLLQLCYVQIQGRRNNVDCC